MCSHGYFYRGNAVKQTRATFSTITNVTFIKRTVYVSYIVPSIKLRCSRGRGGGLIPNFKP